jgi:hypothetical protein
VVRLISAAQRRNPNKCALQGLARTTRVLLVAIVHSSVDPVVLPGSQLQNLTLGTRFVAVRSVEIV